MAGSNEPPSSAGSCFRPPTILSLDEMRIELHPDVRRHLSSQYEPFFSSIALSSCCRPSSVVIPSAPGDGDCHDRDGDGHGVDQPRPTSSLLDLSSVSTSIAAAIANSAAAVAGADAGVAAATAAAESHLDRILEHMKRSPSITCCRVNRIKATVEEVRIELDDALSLWRERRRRRWQRCVEGISFSRQLRDQVEGAGAGGAQKSVYAVVSKGGGVRGIRGGGFEVSQVPRVFDKSGQDDDDDDDDDDDMLARPSAVLPDVLVLGRPGAEANTARCHSVPPLHPATADRGRSYLFSNWTKRSDKGWPMTHRVVVVDRMCGEAVLRGSDVFVRGVLAADAGIGEGETVAVYTDVGNDVCKSVPRGTLLEKYHGRCVFLGVGTSGCGRSDMFRLSRGLAVDMSSGTDDSIVVGPDLPPLNGVLEGKMMLQNLPSAVVAHVLDPRPGDVVLDMCSAPGGKACHAASLMRNVGLLVACDKSRRKMIAAKELFEKMGASCVVPLALDSTDCVVRDGSSWRSVKEVLASATTSTKDGLVNAKAFHPESFDRILLDPPCSALGLRPKLRVDARSLPDLQKHAEYQRKFVGRAVALLKPGGTMTYSTCTINASENEAMVHYVIAEHPCMELVPIRVELGKAGLPGHGLSGEECGMVRRFDPCDDGDTMGFFIAKFAKKQCPR